MKFLKISDSTYTQFEAIRQKLHDGVSQSQAKVLGMSCLTFLVKLLSRFFVLLQSGNASMSPKQQAESEKVIQQVLETFRKYMPWSVSFFGNERLLPLVDYMTSLMKEQGQQVYITYPVTLQLVQQAETLTQQIRDGNMQSITAAFETLIQIVDLGVTSLVREPKSV